MDQPEALQQSMLDQQIHDIYHIAFLLRQKLVPDLISPILDYAEIYWSSANESQCGKNVRVSQSNAPREVLTSDGVVAKARVQHPVRKVVFTITSHDQGWASRRDSGSWTWFTARKIPHGDASPPDTTNANQESIQSMVICRNRPADREWYTHEVTWRADSDDREETEWVSSLMTGDRIIIEAWARFPGWINNVQHATITIDTTAIA